jgi:hypothetical protein
LLNKSLKWIAFAVEGFLAVPLLGGAFIVASGWTPLWFTGLLHAAAIILLLMSKRLLITGNLAGLAGALLGWIPLVGWFLHLAAAVILLFEALFIGRDTPVRRRYQS